MTNAATLLVGTSRGAMAFAAAAPAADRVAVGEPRHADPVTSPESRLRHELHEVDRTTGQRSRVSARTTPPIDSGPAAIRSNAARSRPRPARESRPVSTCAGPLSQPNARHRAPASAVDRREHRAVERDLGEPEPRRPGRRRRRTTARPARRRAQAARARARRRRARIEFPAADAPQIECRAPTAAPAKKRASDGDSDRGMSGAMSKRSGSLQNTTAFAEDLYGDPDMHKLASH